LGEETYNQTVENAALVLMDLPENEIHQLFNDEILRIVAG
jgi:hypothetical protein